MSDAAQSAAALVAQLAEAGTPPQLLAAVAQALFKAETETAALEARRANDRARQARRHVSSREVTCDDVKPCDPSLNGFPPTPLSLVPNQENPPLSPRKRRQKAALTFPEPPDWMPFEPWAAFCQLRKGMEPKVPWSPDACERVIAKIDRLRGEGHCPTKLLDKAVENSHRTVFPGDDTKAVGTNGSTGPPRPLTTDELRRAIQFNEDQGNTEKAKAYRYQLEARQALAGGIQ